MDPRRFVSSAFGRIERTVGPDGPYDAFVPAVIPRDVALSQETVLAMSEADRALGRLSGAGRLLPDPHILVQPYLAREALASSRIEGTQASLSEIFDSTARGREVGEVREVRNYIRALERGIDLLASLPISMRLFTDLHAVLLGGVRGDSRAPGEIRRTQNWIGSPDDRAETAVFVPPPPQDLPLLITDWERFVNERPGSVPPLIRCALLHYQFETIHPFLDGNGRLGRLLIPLFLLEQGILTQPLLYISAFFEQRRNDYYDHLQLVRERGQLQEWMRFFLRAVEVQALDAVERAERLMDLRERYRQATAQTRSRAPQAVDLLFQNPVVSVRYLSTELKMTPQGTSNIIRQLEEMGILQRLAPSRRGVAGLWVADEILETLQEAAEAAPKGPRLVTSSE